MRGFLLAAGRGERLSPLTDRWPKPLLPIGATPAIEWALAAYRRANIERVIVNAHHLREAVRSYFARRPLDGTAIELSIEETLLGTGGGLVAISDRLDEATLIVNGDVLFTGSLEGLIETHRTGQHLATLLIRASAEPSGRALGVDANGKVRRILDRSARSSDTTRSAATLHDAQYTGIGVYSRRILEYLPRVYPSCLVRDGLIKALDAGESIAAVWTNEYWVDTGTHRDYYYANIDQAIACGGQIVHSTATVAADAELRGKVVIGMDSVIGSGVVLEDVVVLPGTRLIEPTHLKGQLIDGARAWSIPSEGAAVSIR